LIVVANGYGRLFTIPFGKSKSLEVLQSIRAKTILSKLKKRRESKVTLESIGRSLPLPPKLDLNLNTLVNILRPLLGSPLRAVISIFDLERPGCQWMDSVLAMLSLTWFRNVPELLFVSLTKNLPPLSTHISACQ
jgi:hypothetical protein